VPEEVFKDAAARAQFVTQSMTDVARVGLAVAVRRGAVKPDISTPEALKRALLQARSVASIPASATGTQLAGIYERLGITEEMKARTKPQPGPPQIAAAVAGGDAEIAVFTLNVLMDPRLEVVGPFPPEIQREIVYAAALAANGKQPEAAKSFVNYLKSAPAGAVIKMKGMNPG
jgi:molybdate transport system substrate-binding protein